VQQWDYHIEALGANEKVLKRLGQEGWELIAVHGGFGYFKRPIPVIIGPITIGPFEMESVPQPPQDSSAWPGATRTNCAPVRWSPFRRDTTGKT
jgi:hypothetical protein